MKGSNFFFTNSSQAFETPVQTTGNKFLKMRLYERFYANI